MTKYIRISIRSITKKITRKNFVLLADPHIDPLWHNSLSVHCSYPSLSQKTNRSILYQIFRLSGKLDKQTLWWLGCGLENPEISCFDSQTMLDELYILTMNLELLSQHKRRSNSKSHSTYCGVEDRPEQRNTSTTPTNRYGMDRTNFSFLYISNLIVWDRHVMGKD